MADYMSLNPEKIVLDVARRVAGKLNKLIDDGHDTTAFTIAIIIAALKDSLDLFLTATLVGLFPLLGQIPGLLFSAILTLFLWGKGWTYFKKTRLKIIWFVVGFFFDNIPLFDALPITTILTFIAWRDVRKKAEKAREDLENLHNKTLQELEEIEEETLVTDAEAREESSESLQERVWRTKMAVREAETAAGMAGGGLAGEGAATREAGVATAEEVPETAFGMPEEVEAQKQRELFEEIPEEAPEPEEEKKGGLQKDISAEQSASTHAEAERVEQTMKEVEVEGNSVNLKTPNANIVDRSSRFGKKPPENEQLKKAAATRLATRETGVPAAKESVSAGQVFGESETPEKEAGELFENTPKEIPVAGEAGIATAEEVPETAFGIPEEVEAQKQRELFEEIPEEAPKPGEETTFKEGFEKARKKIGERASKEEEKKPEVPEEELPTGAMAEQLGGAYAETERVGQTMKEVKVEGDSLT